VHRERIIDSAYFVLAATASDVSAAANSETAVTDCLKQLLTVSVLMVMV